VVFFPKGKRSKEKERKEGMGGGVLLKTLLFPSFLTAIIIYMSSTVYICTCIYTLKLIAIATAVAMVIIDTMN